MYKKIYLCLLLLPLALLGQKKPIDYEACVNWKSLMEVGPKGTIISNDGKYIVYGYGKNGNEQTTILKGIHSNLKVEYSNVRNCAITEDSKRFIALINDTLIIQSLLKTNKSFITKVDYFITPKQGSGRWLAFKTKNEQESKFILLDLASNKRKEFINAEMIWFNPEGSKMIVKKSTSLSMLDLISNKQIQLLQDDGPVNVFFDDTGQNCAILTKSRIEYYCSGTSETNAVYIEGKMNLNESLVLDEYSPIRFCKDGSKISFSLKERQQSFPLHRNDTVNQSVNVRSYKDVKLLERQYVELRQSQDRTYLACLNLQSKKIVRLENEQLRVDDKIGNRYALLRTDVVDDEFYWNKQVQQLQLISLSDGKVIKVFENMYPGYNNVKLSLNEDYVVYFDAKEKQYKSYEIKTGLTRVISQGIDNLTITESKVDKWHRNSAYGVSSWIDSTKVLIYDRWDIWQLDITGNQSPICVTRKIGKRNDIRFRTINDGDFPYILKNKLILNAFNYRNKENGFWEVGIYHNAFPLTLEMSPCVYNLIPEGPIVTRNACNNPERFQPNKARNSNTFIVRRMSANEAPNLYFTHDFIKFERITNFQPQKDYAWFSSQLVKWTTPNGKENYGVLYKPENIQVGKKYPIIFNYYTKRSDGLNVFKMPELAGHNVNIPWLISRGYLVFEPDFYYEPGRTAKNIQDVVESAADCLTKFPYADTARIGLQGQSFGGYETNVIIGKSNRFKAACEMAGPTNLISEYGAISSENGLNFQITGDIGSRNLGVSPWDMPEVFVQNSPVFNIGKVNTPLLMVHNKNDFAIPYAQAIELFNGMRRAGKKVWMLEYEGEGHSIRDEKNQLDFTIRMQQFFDHYLKGYQAPKWMTLGRPAKLRGIDDRLELDSPGVIP